jgi:hypothetical protein
MNISMPDLRSLITHGCHFCDCPSTHIYICHAELHFSFNLLMSRLWSVSNTTTGQGIEDVFVCKEFMPAVAVTQRHTVQRLSYTHGELFNIDYSGENDESLN